MGQCVSTKAADPKAVRDSEQTEDPAGQLVPTICYESSNEISFVSNKMCDPHSELQRTTSRSSEDVSMPSCVRTHESAVM